MSPTTMDAAVMPKVYENTCMRGDKVNCGDQECYYSGTERCCELKDGLPDDTKCRSSNFASLTAKKWNQAVETAQNEIKKAMDAAMKAKLAKIVEQCTPCLSTHDDHGHKTGISMKEWDELNCDECLDKDEAMGSKEAEQWVTFQDYKQRRSEWEAAMAKLREERKQRSQTCKSLNIKGKLCEGNGLEQLIQRCAKNNTSISMQDIQTYAQEFKTYDHNNDGVLKQQEFIDVVQKHYTGIKYVRARSRAIEIMQTWGNPLTFESYIQWRHQCPKE